MSRSTVASQYLVGLASPLGHSMSSVSSAKRASPRIGETRTRTWAKRDRSFLLVPSRHATAWADDKARRNKAHVPASIRFKTNRNLDNNLILHQDHMRPTDSDR